MKIAIPTFGDRVSPRFDFSPELWVLEVKRGEVVSQEKLSSANLNISQRVEQITSNGVDKVICGGIDEFSMSQLGSKGIEVVQDVIGEAAVAFGLFLKGRLRPGSCCDRRRRKGFCVWKGDPHRRRTIDDERKM